MAGEPAGSTVRRNLKPVGRRGKSYVYARADVIAFLAGEPVSQPAAATRTVSARAGAVTTSDALEKLAAIRKGAKPGTED